MIIDVARALIISRCAMGEWADLRTLPEDQRVVEAEFIRDLLLGIHQPANIHQDIATQFTAYRAFTPIEAAPFFVAPPGVRIRGATINGILDLVDCVGRSGEGLPRLALEFCLLEGSGSSKAADFSRARLAALSLRGSRFSYVRAVDCIVDGRVDIEQVQPLNDWKPQTFPIDDPEWRVKLRKAAGRSDLLDADTTVRDENWREGRIPLDEAWPDSWRDHCWMDFEGARIGAGLHAAGSRLRSPENSWYALDLGRAVIGGPVYLVRSVVEGGVRINDTTIGGQFEASGARFIGGRDSALSAESVTVGSGMLLRDGFLAHGAIWLLGGKIAGTLVMTGACLDGRGSPAISADMLAIGGALQMRDDFYASGCLWLIGCTIGASLEMGRNCFVAFAEDEAIVADNMVVGADMLMREDFNVLGTVRLVGASIARDFELHGAMIVAPGMPALLARDMTVGSRLVVKMNLIVGEFDLTDASCRTLVDAPAGYRGVEKLDLDGFRYDRIVVTEGCWQDRAYWLSRQFAGAESAKKRIFANLPRPKSLEEYHPQPYLQMAKTLSSQGHDGDARRILSLRRSIERDVAAKWYVKPFSWLFWLLFDYGLSAGRALATLAIWLVVGAVLIAVANARGGMVVDAQSVTIPGQRLASSSVTAAPVACGDQINPPIYAIDLFIPLVDLRQESKCEVGVAPGSHLAPGFDFAVPRASMTLHGLFAEVELWRWAKALYGMCGWILTSLAILTFSGVLRRQAEQA